jgi:signal transduction histidine kinase
MEDHSKTKTQLIDELAVIRQRLAELETLEVEHQQVMEKQEKLIAELDAFAYTVAHDLQAPLSVIVGFADMLERDAAALPLEQLQDFLRTIIWSGRRLSQIIDELLLLAQVRQQEEIPLSPLDMAAILIEAQQSLAHLIAENKAEIILPSQWPIAIGYAPWIVEVWTNYLSNGLKYGGQPPRLELGANEQSDGLVRFWVRDNGQGLTSDQQTQLFVPFTQLSQVRTKGHGLGLSIVFRIIGRLGGQVGVESKGIPGQGSLFFFTLPAATPPNTLATRYQIIA